MLNDKPDSESVQFIVVHLIIFRKMEIGKSEVELTFLLNMILIVCLVKTSLP